jgi:hypothetical protein
MTLGHEYHRLIWPGRLRRSLRPILWSLAINAFILLLAMIHLKWLSALGDLLAWPPSFIVCQLLLRNSQPLPSVVDRDSLITSLLFYAILAWLVIISTKAVVSRREHI